jgi:hypothetical protein
MVEFGLSGFAVLAAGSFFFCCFFPVQILYRPAIIVQTPGSGFFLVPVYRFPHNRSLGGLFLRTLLA